MEMMQIAQKTRNSGIITLGSCMQPEHGQHGRDLVLHHADDPARPQIRDLDHDGFCAARHPHAVVSAAIIQRFLANSSRERRRRMFPCDPSIALPMVITALSQTAAKFMKGRKRPNFSFAGKEMTIDVP